MREERVLHRKKKGRGREEGEVRRPEENGL